MEMGRGEYSYMTENKAYIDSKKSWAVELSNTHMYWYDLLVNPSEVAEYFDTRQIIVDHLKRLKNEVEENLEKRFIYFICSRTKVRFDTSQKFYYSPFRNSAKIRLLIGKDKKKKSIYITFADTNTIERSKPRLEVWDKYITIHRDEENKETYSVHDFLAHSGTNLGFHSNVEYVGYTKNPHSRPTNGSHTGLSDALFNVSNEDNDTLLFFNLFKVTTIAESANSILNFYISNTMSDEVKVDLEGKLIEKSFILYFDSNNQNRNKKQELEELEKNLNKISNENNINSIHYSYEMDGESEYWNFSSSKIDGKKEHVFTIESDENGINIVDSSEIFRGQIN